MRHPDEFKAAAGRRVARSACALALAVLAACAAPRQELPPLLAHATAAGGPTSACPARSDSERAVATPSDARVSRELTDRLAQRFPQGSPASALKDELLAEGFGRSTACEADPTIAYSTFFRQGSGLLAYDAYAWVYWKSSNDGKIVWTKGFVVYAGL